MFVKFKGFNGSPVIVNTQDISCAETVKYGESLYIKIAMRSSKISITVHETIDDVLNSINGK